MLIFLDRLFNALAGEIDQCLVLPVLYHFGWMEWEELSFDWALVCVYGMFAVLITYAVCWPLEAAFPVERWNDRKAVLTAMVYTFASPVSAVPHVHSLLSYHLHS